MAEKEKETKKKALAPRGWGLVLFEEWTGGSMKSPAGGWALSRGVAPPPARVLAPGKPSILQRRKETSAEMMLGLAAITFVLGITYWLIRERDDRLLLGHRERNPSFPSYPPEARR
jgi:Phosphate-starvation-inducible E family